jgi:chromosome segregation ATPase
MEIQTITIITLLFFGGGFFGIFGLLWKISKRDSAITTVSKDIESIEEKVKTLETKIELDEKTADGKIVNIEKELIEIKANQSNLLNSIDTQTGQVLDLIDRLEKNHNGYIKSQSRVNEKLEKAIDAIKDSIINKK